ncbi:unnamed protein product [Rhizoctonia solani]|uniref:UBC core domain-containing protein n=3 Tax=Rhizoctonia solani TaxID=456999 RepID=A0A8H3BIX7_9AGAM|nr:ubiquitin-conjugating enzyme E2, putative [Rhizoctonia solani AG-3 Rhs1AP]KEP49374.1 putative ubiquitin-conjugating enzyme E2 [Rhizoctonia solani 123E]CAE6409270.1 unnamed protein product [Rhizoctonia solani]CAE6457029.1 unnamed protein product [Rhizoctonia solani]
MATRSSHNKNNAAVKRILQEAKELLNDPSHEYSAGPLENDIFEWHATLRGAPDTEFEGGLYHCRILLPAEYPFRPPSIMVLTPNGRFELNKKICISFTNYHEELWQPAWGVRTAIIGIQGFFPHKGEAAVGVGALEYPISERKRLATLSREWYCPDCEQTCLQMLPDPPASSESDPSSEKATGEPEKPVEEAEAKVEQATLEPPEIVTTNSSSTESTVRPTNPSPTPTTPAQAPTPIEAPRPAPGAVPAPNRLNNTNPAQTRTAIVRSSPKPPLVLDLVIVSLVSIFIAILARRIL